MVPDPVGVWAAALILALPAIWWAGRGVGWASTRDLWQGRILGVGVGLAAWLLAVHITGIVSGSFTVGLWGGTLGVALIGGAIRFSGAVSRPLPEWLPDRKMLVGMLVAVAVFTPVALGWSIHDELWLTGHMSITARIQNGAYPPSNLNFPSLGLRYHYGFDLLAAIVTSLFRLPIDVGIDVITLFCAGWLFVLLWMAGDMALGRRWAWVAPVVVMLASGFTFACGLVTEGSVPSMLGACTTGGIFVNPPVPSYFFQHPWTIGLPLAVTTVLVFASELPRRGRYPTLGLLLLALSLCQVVLFATLAAAFVAADAWDGKQLNLRRGLAMLITSGLTALVATRLGGFFAPWPASPGAGLGLRAGITADPMATLLWHVASFGWALPLGAWGLALAPRGRVRTLLICLVLGSLALLNLVQYRASWDIAKFGTVALLALAAGSAWAAARMMEAGRRTAASASIAAVTAGGAAFLLILGFRLPGIPAPLSGSPTSLGPDDAAAVSWLRLNAGPEDVVYRSPPWTLGYAQWGGLPQAHLDRMARELGLPADLIAAREHVLTVLPAQPTDFLDQGIRWLVLGPEDAILRARVQEWITAGTAAERARFGRLEIIEMQRPRG